MRALRILAKLVAGTVALLALLLGLLQTPAAQRLLASVVSGASLKVSDIEGFIPTDLSVGRIELLDREGAWLTIENAHLRWSFASLFDGRVQIETLSASRIDVLRQPIADAGEQKTEAGGSFALPLDVELQALSVGTFHLAPSVAEIDSSWRLQGSAFASADLREVRLRLSGDRSDGPQGRLSTDLRLDLIQATVDGDLTFEEGQGGVLAALLERTDLDRVTLKVVAKGDARSGDGELSFAAGDAATITGSARWRPAGEAVAVSARLEAAGTRIVERGGPVALTVEATLDSAAATLTSSVLTAGPLTVSASGRYDRKADRLDATTTARFDGPGPPPPYSLGVRWRDLQMNAHAVLDDLAAQPHGSVSLNGAAEELVVPELESRLPPLGRLAFDGRVGLRRDGSLVLDTLDVTSALVSVRATDGSFDPKTQSGAAKAAIDLPNLAPLSALAGKELGGRVHLELSGQNSSQGTAVDWRGTLADLAVADVPPALIAPQLTLSGAARLGVDDRWTLADVRAASDAFAFGLSGSGQGASGHFDLSLDLKQFAALRPGVEGAITVSSTADVRADGTAEGSVSAQGQAQGRPLSLAGRFALDAGGGIVVPSLDFTWSSAALNVADLAVSKQRTSGSVRLKIERLQDFAALVGTELAGSLEAEVKTDAERAAGRLHLSVRGNGLQSGGMGVGALEANATVDDPTGGAAADLHFVASGLRGAADIGRVQGTVKGDRASGFDVALQASGAQTSANLGAKVELLGEEIRIALSRLDARRQAITASLAAPTRFVVAGERVRIEPTTLNVIGGRVSMQGVVDPAASDLGVEVALPLARLEALAPGTNLDGNLQARARLRGAAADPRIEANWNVSNVRLRRPEMALLPALAMQGSGTLANGQATFDSRLTAGAGANLSVKGRMAMAPMGGSVAIAGTIDMAPFAPLLGTGVRGLAGTWRSDLTVDIAGSRVTGRGSLDLSNGALALPDAGLRLSGGSGRLVLQGDTVQVQRLAFKSGNSGEVTVNGTVGQDSAQGVAVDLAVASRRALLVSRPDLVAIVSSDLKIAGSTGAGIEVSGPITIDRAEISIGGGQSASYPTLDVREINRPGVPNPPAQPARQGAASRGAGPSLVRLAIDVRAPQAIFVRGRGLDAELGGDVRVTGDPASPSVTGGLQIRRGDFTLAGRRLAFSRGIVTLDNLNRIDPRLDFVANTTVQSTTITITIAGTPRKPEITISSSPALPQDEALALLLFGKRASALSATELVQIAQTLAELTGREPAGGGLLGSLRQGLGLDQLRVGTSDSAQGGSPVSLEAGRYVAPGVYVGAKQGAAGNSSRGVVEIEVLDNTKIEGDIGADSRGRVGVKMEWDY